MPASGSGSMAARTLLRVVEFCRARGHDAEALCRSAGLSLRSLSEHDARIPYPLAARLGERALALTGDHNFGLHLAQDVRDTGQYEAGLLLLMASPTVRVALERMVSYQRYWGDGERSTLLPVAGGAILRYLLAGADGEYRRHSDECAMAEVALGVRVLSGHPIAPRVVRFRHARPGDTTEHAALFQCPLEFASEHTEIVFDDPALDTAMRHGNAAFAAIFAQQVERALERLNGPARTSERVREAARATLAVGAASLHETARALGVSSRTLQRRLQEEGTSFAEVLDTLRHELALAYVERDLALTEVALLLGYADVTAFHHAFQRWTGTSPTRHELRPEKS